MTTPTIAAAAFAAAALLAAAPSNAQEAVRPGAGPQADPGAGAYPPASLGEGPPNARPGQCFQKVERPPLFETVRETVVDQPERVSTRTLPAQFRWEDRQVLVSPGRVDERAVPEVGHDVSETVVVRPPSMRVDTLAPVYDTVMRRVMVRPGRTYWKPSMGPTGEILCLVSEPPLFADQPQTVMREPARTIQTPIPGETRVVVRHVVDVAAHVERRDVPPVYRTDHVSVLVAPERQEVQTIPAVTHVVEHRRMVSPGGWDWRQIRCAPPPPCPTACGAPPPPPPPPPCATCLPPPHDTDAGRDEAPGDVAPPPPRRGLRPEHRRERGAAATARPANVTAQIQTALRRRGVYKGPVDGLYTPETMHALGAFEREHGLPVGPPTPQVARALGVY